MMIRWMTVSMLAVLLLASGCRSEPRSRAEEVETRKGDRGTGLSSADLTHATDMAVEKIAALPEIRQTGGRTVIVMDTVLNRTSDPTADFRIFLARIRASLNQSGATENLVFVESRRTAESIRAREGQGVAANRALPQYALHATFYDMPRGRTNYHLLEFNLVNLANDLITPAGSYEVKISYP